MNRSAITNTANTTLAMPLAVIKARFTRRRSLGLTMECWYRSMLTKMATPIQYNQLKWPYTPAMITQAALSTCNNSDTRNALDLPSQAGIEYNRCDLSNSSSCNA